MGDLNHISCVIRILEIPYLRSYENSILFTIFRVELPQTNKQDLKITSQIIAWGYLATQIVECYQINDYLLIEGYTYFKHINNKKVNSQSQQTKNINITVQKVFPFF